MKVKFSECVEYMIKGPFGSDMKKSLYVPKGEDTYKVYVQGNAIQKDENLGDYYVSSEYFHRKLERFQVHPGDYIITCDGTLGKYIKLSENIEPGVISSSLLLLKLDETKIYDKFFELIWENSMLKYLASQARNACLVHLPSAKAIGDVEIELPEMSIQREIADKAFLIKDILNKRNEELCLLDELIKARFVEMFGDPVTNPNQFLVVRLGELSELITKGASPSWQGFSYTEDSSQTLFITSENVRDGYLNLSAPKYIEDGFNEKQGRSVLKKGDFLINIVGASIGRAAQFNLECKANMNQAAALVRINDRRVRDKYLLTYLNSDKAQQMYDSMKSDTGRANLSLLDIGNLSILIPPIEKQIGFERFVEQVDKSKLILLTVSNYLNIVTENIEVIFIPRFVTLHHRK